MLATLRNRLDGPISPELKRRITETLIERIQADTVERFGVKQSEITIEYRFSQPSAPAARPAAPTGSTTGSEYRRSWRQSAIICCGVGSS